MAARLSAIKVGEAPTIQVRQSPLQWFVYWGQIGSCRPRSATSAARVRCCGRSANPDWRSAAARISARQDLRTLDAKVRAARHSQIWRLAWPHCRSRSARAVCAAPRTRPTHTGQLLARQLVFAPKLLILLSRAFSLAELGSAWEIPGPVLAAVLSASDPAPLGALHLGES